MRLEQFEPTMLKRKAARVNGHHVPRSRVGEVSVTDATACEHILPVLVRVRTADMGYGA